MPRLFRLAPLALLGLLGRAAATDAAAAAKPKLDYAKALQLSPLFYEAQRSGKLPANNRVPWRGDSALNDGSDHGVDLSGGWYDAGDHIKFAFPQAWSATTLIWGILEYGDAWKAAGEWDHALDMVKWPLDYFIKCHPDPDTFFVQVGDGNADHQYWGSAEGMNMGRPSYAISSTNPGTEYAAEGAAALAAGAVLFKNDAAYSAILKTKAESLFKLADEHRATSTISDPFYKSYSGYWDELAWAAVWLYKATGNHKYLDKAEKEYYENCCTNTAGEEFSWDRKSVAAQLILYEITKKPIYKDGFKAYMDYWLDPTKAKRTPKGLVYFDQWAPNRYAANTAFIALVAADLGIEPQVYRDFAASQIDYILTAGNYDVNPDTGNPNYSYLIGFGDNFPRAPHHRGASCGNGWCSCGGGAEPNVLLGAMVGGPDDKDNYNDSCNDYVHAEVATDYNAGFTSACAGLLELRLAKPQGGNSKPNGGKPTGGKLH